MGYPPLLYAEGKSPAQVRSMNHYCVLANIGSLKLKLGDDVWSYLESSPLGCIVKLAGSNFIWSAQTVHYLLTHQLVTNKSKELWCLVDDQPIRLSLLEFGYVTGMNIDPYDVGGVCEGDHKELWCEMEVPISEGPSWDQLLKVLDVCKLWSFEKRRSIGCLCVIAIGVLGLHRGSKIPLDLAKRVIDVETFERFPWGRKACEKLVEDIKVVQYVGDSYCIPGFVHVLQIWGYEAISILGESVSRKEHDIPLLAWPRSRGRTKIADLLFKEKNKHGKVRVRHIFSISEEDVIPSWTDEEEDENVDTLLNDIIEGILNCGFWSKDTKSEKKRGKKRKVDLVVEECTDDDFVEKKKKIVRIMNGSKQKKSRDDEDGRDADFQEPVERESSKEKVVTQKKRKKKLDNEPEKGAEKVAEKVADKQPEKEAEKQAEKEVEKQADKIGEVGDVVSMKGLASLFETLATNMLRLESKIGEKIDDFKGEMEGRRRIGFIVCVGFGLFGLGINVIFFYWKSAE